MAQVEDASKLILFPFSIIRTLSVVEIMLSVDSTENGAFVSLQPVFSEEYVLTIPSQSDSFNLKGTSILQDHFVLFRNHTLHNPQSRIFPELFWCVFLADTPMRSVLIE